MAFFIDIASESDIENIYKVMSSCTDWLKNQNMKHWINAYPLEKVKDRVGRGMVYKITEENEVIGTISLSSEKPFYYKEDDDKCWENPSENAIYISGLAILPDHMGKGYATKLLDFVEKKCKNENIKYIRFDAVSYYEKLIEFYKKRDYKIVRTRVTGQYESHFFEKCL
jgi:GNAT superfamily N-acetyltransferase